MRKTRMISVIAASLLTATVVFTGCGGGGSSTTPASSSSAASSSSTPTVTVKKVKVSDGYVLQATVKCKDANGNDVAQAVATQTPGEYEFSLTNGCPVLCAKDGYIDVNNNGAVDQGEPKAPKMGAPGTYSNVNLFTTLIANGLTPAEVAQAFGLPANTNFDVAIPEASNDMKIKAYQLSIVLSYLQTQATTKACLPGQPCDETTTSSSEATSSSQAPVTVNTLEDLIAALKSGKTFNDVIPQDVQDAVNAVESAGSAEDAEKKAADFLAKNNGCYECGSSSSSNETSGGGTSSEGTSSSEMSSSSETNSSSSEMSSSSQGGEECLPGQPCGSSSSQTSSETSSSSNEATSSSEASSSSVETGDFPSA